MSLPYPLDIQPIGHIHTPFRQKFAIPRQSNLACARGEIILETEYADPDAFKGIEAYSHLWLLFHFHETASRGWKNTVKAPRLGGNATWGVFATRSTHRPNSIGLSVVKNHGLQIQEGRASVLVSGVDLMHQTPILDIKPYIAYADAISHATDGLERYAPIPSRTVIWRDDAAAACTHWQQHYPDLRALITAVLSQDPRPAYKQKRDDDEKEYKVMLYDLDICWKISQGKVVVIAIDPVRPLQA